MPYRIRHQSRGASAHSAAAARDQLGSGSPAAEQTQRKRPRGLCGAGHRQAPLEAAVLTVPARCRVPRPPPPPYLVGAPRSFGPGSQPTKGWTRYRPQTRYMYAGYGVICRGRKRACKLSAKRSTTLHLGHVTRPHSRRDGRDTCLRRMPDMPCHDGAPANLALNDRPNLASTPRFHPLVGCARRGRRDI